MNYNSNKHIIEYIEGNKVKQFEVPKKDYNLKFDKMSYNDVLMYIKLTKEEQDKEKQNKQENVIKYKPLKTVFAKTKDYFDQDIKLMSQAEKLRKIAEYLVSDNIQELKEFLSNDVFNDDPIIKSVMELLNHKGYTNDEIKDLMQRKDKVDLYTSKIEKCIIKDGDNHYSFVNITFKNTLGDLLNLSRQVGVLEKYKIYVPVDNTKIDFKNKQSGFDKLKNLIFGTSFNTTKGRPASVFLTDNYFTPSIHYNNSGKFTLSDKDLNGFTLDKSKLDTSKLPLYFYFESEYNQKIYINLKILYYLLQFNESFKNNNYRFVVEKLKNGITAGVILIAGSAFDLDNILNSLYEKDDDLTDYYNEYKDLMTDTISKFFNKQFTPVIQVTSVNKPVYYSDDDQDLTDDKQSPDSKEDEKSEDKTLIKPVEPVNDKVPVKPVEDELDDLDKEAKGLGLFSFRKDTKETLQSLLNRIVKLESVISYQNEQIKQLKNGIKSINQALPSSIRKNAFGNYFSNSLESSSEDNYNLGGALNPDKVYPKITFSEFRKLYNKL